MRLQEELGCRCRAHLTNLGEREKYKGKVPGHTFPWAKTQYLDDRPVLPTHQFLDLKLDVDGETLTGTNTMSLTVQHKEVSSFRFDAVDLKIHSVKVGGKDVSYEVEQATVLVKLPTPLTRGQKTTLEVSYTCHKPKAGLYFIKPDKNYPDRATQVWTQGQDDDARYWFPTFDEPRIKTSLEMKVEVPSGFIATSNGALLSETKTGKYWTFHWKTSVLIPSYLVTLTAGKFSEIKSEWRGKTVNYLVEKGLEEEAKISFGKTPQMMDLFSQCIGIDYPYEKYTQIAVSEFVFGGMENTSATTQTDTTLHPIEIAEDFTSDDLVSHELAHQWFGDLVTCKSWWHGWLNEGWATFMEYVWKEKDLGRDETDYYRYEDLNTYLGEDESYRRSIVSNFYTDPGEIWDRHLYQKAGLVINMLRAELGDEDFWAGTKLYLERHKGGVVETIDFQRALEEVSGRSLDLFFDQWIFKGGYPEFKISFDWDEKTKIGKFKVAQKQKTDELTPLFKISTKADFYFADKSKHTVDLDLDDAEQVFAVPMKEKPQYCVFDPGNNILKTVEWALPLEMLKNQLKNSTDVVGKIWALKQLQKDGAREGVEAIASTLKTDSFWAVRAEAALCLGECKTPTAKKALLECLAAEKKSKVRTKICTALGGFLKDDDVAETLKKTISNDKNIFVKGAAANSIGKVKCDGAFDVLKKAIDIKSWNDYVASQAYSGLKHLRDDKALDLFIKGSEYGAPKLARGAAITALGEYGLQNRGVTDHLKEILSDPYSRARFVAADALAKRKDPSVIGSLEDAANRVVDGHFKAAAFRAARRIRKNLEKPEELTNLRETMDKIISENKKLQERLHLLEEKSK